MNDGRCGDVTPQLFRSQLLREHCALPAGHAGWHRSDEGAEWTWHGPEPPEKPGMFRSWPAAAARLSAWAVLGGAFSGAVAVAVWWWVR